MAEITLVAGSPEPFNVNNMPEQSSARDRVNLIIRFVSSHLFCFQTEIILLCYSKWVSILVQIYNNKKTVLDRILSGAS